eukprot:Gb_00739 [translate_table: standard]
MLPLQPHAYKYFVETEGLQGQTLYFFITEAASDNICKVCGTFWEHCSNNCISCAARGASAPEQKLYKAPLSELRAILVRTLLYVWREDGKSYMSTTCTSPRVLSSSRFSVVTSMGNLFPL